MIHSCILTIFIHFSQGCPNVRQFRSLYFTADSKIKSLFVEDGKKIFNVIIIARHFAAADEEEQRKKKKEMKISCVMEYARPR